MQYASLSVHARACVGYVCVYICEYVRAWVFLFARLLIYLFIYSSWKIELDQQVYVIILPQLCVCVTLHVSASNSLVLLKVEINRLISGVCIYIYLHVLIYTIVKTVKFEMFLPHCMCFCDVNQ